MTIFSQMMNAQMPVALRIGTLEIVLIAVVALVLFGGSRLSGLGKSLGQSIREFRDEMGKGKDKDKGNANAADTTAKTDAAETKKDGDPPAQA